MDVKLFFDICKWRMKISFNVRRKSYFRYDSVDLFAKVKEDVLFIHIPKSAGMSFVRSLYNANHSSHARAIDYIEQDESRYQSLFTFCVSREPFQRLQSAYYYLESGGQSAIDMVWRERYLAGYDGLDNFILDGGLEKAIEERAQHFIPQVDFIRSPEGSILVDYIGRYENLNETIRTVSSVLGREFKLSKENVGSRVLDNRCQVSREAMDVVRRVYKDDYECFDYS